MQDYKNLCEVLAFFKASQEPEYHCLVDIGSKCYMQAVVEDPHSIYVHVGAGIHLELNFDTAFDVCKQRVDVLQR